MLGKLSFIGVCIALVAASAVAWAADPAPASEGLLVLRNGSILTGQVVRAGDFYLITGQGVETRLRAGDVDFFCRDLREAYARKRLAVQADDWEGRLALAGWCLRHDALEGAEEQVAAILAVAPQSRRAETLAKQIAERKRDLTTPRTKSDVGPAGPRSSDLELLVRGLPASTVSDFTDVIQPLLLNNCATAGCHGARSTAQFRLLKPSRGPSRRLTHRNLHATVAWINRADPPHSRLLTAAGEPHGGLSLPVFSRTKATHYRQLASWIAGFGSVPQYEDSSPISNTVPLAMSPLSDSAALRPVANRAGRLRRIGAGRASAADLATAPDAQSGVAQAAWYDTPSAAAQAPAPRAARTVAAQRGGDPLDPEIFNRQFAPAQASPLDAMEQAELQPDALPQEAVQQASFERPVPDPAGASPLDSEQATIDAVEAELQSLGLEDAAE